MPTIRYNSITGKAEEILEDLMEHPVIKGVPDKEFALRLIIEEIVVNIVNYAYAEGTSGDMSVSIDKEGDLIVLTFADHGKPFDPLSNDEPDITLSVNDRPIGGLGIFLVKQMSKEVSYRYEDSMNILTVKL